MSLRKPVRFVKGESEREDASNEERANEDDESLITGEEAMTFYQELTSTVTHSKTPSNEIQLRRNSRHRKCGKSIKAKTRMTVEEAKRALFFGSQNGDVEVVKRAVTSGSCEINAKDRFQWTALMCACTAGHYGVVKILLEAGATWEDIFDKCGRNALDLAVMEGFNDIGTLLLRSDHNTDQCRRKRTKTKMTPYWCSECDMNVMDGVHHEHKKSTVHQFSCRRQSGVTLTPHYVLGHRNVGYQMMVRDGWTEDKGLGRDNQGRRYPVKTVLKRNRTGLGTIGDIARVTHFGPFDAMAVQGRTAIGETTGKQATKKELLKSCERERQMEITFRRSFNSSDS